jgi:hypothetical protein
MGMIIPSSIKIYSPSGGFNSPKLASTFNQIFPVNTPWLAAELFIEI